MTPRAVLIGGLCAAIVVGLGVARGADSTGGAAHPEALSRPGVFETVSVAPTSSTQALDPLASDPMPDGSVSGGSVDGPGAAPVAAPARVPATPAAVPHAPGAAVPRTNAAVVTHAPAALPVEPAEVSGAVHQGSFCAARDAVSQSGYTSAGTKMTCSDADEPESQPRWRSAGGSVVSPTPLVPRPSSKPSETPSEAVLAN
jgi:hypothetical protein